LLKNLTFRRPLTPSLEIEMTPHEEESTLILKRHVSNKKD